MLYPLRCCFTLALPLLLTCSLPSDTPVDTPAAASPRLIADQTAYYPRLLRLTHQSGGNGDLLLSFDSDHNRGALFRSADDGRIWTPLSTVGDTTANWHCCSGLWEVPQPLGDVAAGTLFWAPSMGCPGNPRCAARLAVHRSTDGGRTWQPHSTLATGSVGLWEPEFIVDKQGRLVAFYSTEEHRDSGFNQLLAHKISTDGGRTWGPEVRDVALPDVLTSTGITRMRPGMAIVRRLPDGRYAMLYEICGLGCAVYLRFSDNGTDWGDPAATGTRLVSEQGHHFAHAPSFTVLPDGRLVAVGQLLMNARNELAAANGTRLLISQPGGTGPWREIEAPVPVPDAVDNPCPNYSSQLLPARDGRSLIEVALRRGNAGCRAYANVRPIEN